MDSLASFEIRLMSLVPPPASSISFRNTTHQQQLGSSF